MNTHRIAFPLLAAVVLAAALSSPHAVAQIRVTAGVKTWLSTWNIPMKQDLGVSISDFSAAVLAGPYLSIRAGDIAATVMYSRAALPYKGTATNPGMYLIPFESNRTLDREDINIFANYSVAPEVSVFANLKLITYTLREAYASIYERNITFKQEYSGTGIGAGVQIAVPFSGRSPLYSFISTGAFVNSISSKQPDVTVDGQPFASEPVQTETSSELLYFLDAGLGYRFGTSGLGAALGIRVENGKDTKTAIGPTGNLFFSF